MHIFPFANFVEAVFVASPSLVVFVAYFMCLTKNAFANKFRIYPISVYVVFADSHRISRAFRKLIFFSFSVTLRFGYFNCIQTDVMFCFI